MYLHFSEFWRVGVAVLWQGREIRMTKGPGSMSGFDSGLRFSFFLIETLSMTGQTFSKCLKKWQRPFTKGATAEAIVCAKDETKPLVKSVHVTVLKSFFWAPTGVQGSEFAPC